MNAARISASAGQMVLNVQTAAELMTSNPRSLRQDATVREAVAFLLDRGIGGAPVVDDAGRPVGVLTQTDILAYDRGKVRQLADSGSAVGEWDAGEPLPPRFWGEFQVELVDGDTVADVMTPLVRTLPMNATGEQVVAEFLHHDVHRMFVVDESGVLVGVITTLDLLRHMRPVREAGKRNYQA
jgi:CBS domain-containing protein